MSRTNGCSWVYEMRDVRLWPNRVMPSVLGVRWERVLHFFFGFSSLSLRISPFLLLYFRLLLLLLPSPPPQLNMTSSGVYLARAIRPIDPPNYVFQWERTRFGFSTCSLARGRRGLCPQYKTPIFRQMLRKNTLHIALMRLLPSWMNEWL